MANSGGPIQFKGIKKAIEAYENMGLPPWSLWCGKAMNLSYDGDDIEEGKTRLNKYLEMCEQESVATYTLCVYESLPKKTKITNATPYHASFNFKLTEGDYPSRSIMRMNERDEQLLGRIADLEKKIGDLVALQNEERDEPEEMGGIAGVLSGLLDMPEIKQALAGKVVSLLDRFNLFPMNANNPNPPGPQQIGKVAGVEPSPDQVDQINRALQVLIQYDPELGEHLEMLADIAKKDRKKFTNLLSMLKLYA
jgi:hypothetical protein